MDRIIDVFPGNEQSQIRFQLSMVLLAIISQRLLPRVDGDGRILACELLLNNPAVANLIRDSKTHQMYSVVETSHREGMITLDRSLKTLYMRGLISSDEARGHMRHPKELDE